MTRRFFAPNNLDLPRLVDQAEKIIRNFNEDHLKYILHLVNDIALRAKGKYTDGWVPLCSRILVHYVRNYQHYLDFLQAAGIIESDNHYIPGQKSKYYRFTVEYREVPLKEGIIDDASLIKKLYDHRYKSDEYKKANQRYGFLAKFFKSGKLQIDFEAAKAWLDNAYPKDKEAYKRGIMAITRIKEQDWHFSIGSKNGRFYSSLTNMNKELRWFLNYDEEPLFCMDVSSMQPYLLWALFKKSFWRYPYSSADFCLKNINSEVWDSLKAYKDGYSNDYIIDNLIDYIKYINTCTTMVASSYETICCKGFRDMWLYWELIQNGRFYSYMEEEFKQFNVNPIITREQTKKKVMEFFNDNPDAYYYQDLAKTTTMDVFAALFPTVYEFIYRLKVIDYRHVSWLMQGMESKLMLDIVCKGLSKKYPKMPLFTVHDSIATTGDYLEVLENEMLFQLEKYVGVTPHLKIEIWDSEYMMGRHDPAA